MKPRAAALRLFLANSVISSSLVPIGRRARLYRLLGIKVDGLMSFGIYCRLGLKVGRGTYVNARCFFDGNVSLGIDCLIGMDALFVTSTHDILDPGKYGKARALPITVGDRCWIGARATLLPGVTVCDDAVVAAGAVVSRSITEPGVWAGVPARKIRDIEPVGS